MVYLLISLSLIGCYSTKNLIKYADTKPTPFLSRNINGNYTNISKSNSEELWKILYRNKSFKRNKIKFNKSQIVNIEVVNNEQLIIKLFEKSKQIDEFQLKGKVVDDFFVVKRKLFLIPIPFLTIFFETKTIIGNSESGNLTINQGFRNEGWLLIFMGGNMGQRHNYHFEKLNLKQNKKEIYL